MVEPEGERDGGAVVGVVDVVLELLLLLDELGFKFGGFLARALGDVFPEGDDRVAAARDKDVVVFADC